MKKLHSLSNTPTVYLIGGPARVGKSTLSRLLNEQIISHRITGDVLMQMLVKAEAIPYAHVSMEPKDTWLERLVIRDRRLWPHIHKLATDIVTHHNESIIIDGALYPDFLAELPLEVPYRFVVLVDTSSVDVQTERMIEIRDSASSSNNWQKDHSYTDDFLKEWTSLNRGRSLQYVEQAGVHGVKVFDVADYPSQTKMQEAALEWLLGEY
ncbi:MAG: hypothetical protein WAQ27_00405 [Candidatus Microsaccharimonas sp.]